MAVKVCDCDDVFQKVSPNDIASTPGGECDWWHYNLPLHD